MSINFFSEDIDFNLASKNKIRNWIKLSIENELKKTGLINIIFTSDNYLLDINKKYLSHNYLTDIITFNYCEKNTINGDIYISIETVLNNSKRFIVSFEDEIRRVIIHGILHLIGYNDSTNGEKIQMREKENNYLDRYKNLL
ncbi:MAG: rRNA maturation RNase YbeY [Bacteroidetes bacterium GWC2_33_15]|nr:MAG: rRNA maturation RNase YbeY [Bacteroidetes bacterium GWA2_33_15]OFX50823.1 MAG: rRNA maturation RNase YbeY [Bacteroidetes bacterium GWC2_33_15]OFX62894.1 MAG: rRNA maturation RNase YbeY [Bacteroidetes bacterium GWB2_32_14]OFX69964.1 MAG: rRNA maturation RNase YbeY [Bacteroidetes bacterium GWD2_33_33]HAN18959.1 rRNA maturation RNase YbeY [Bacteroidales bacterium]